MEKKANSTLLLYLSVLIIIILSTISITILLIPLTTAINLNIETEKVSETVILDLEKPAILDLTIKNNGETGEFEIYTIVGIDITPDKFELERDEIKKITLNLFPREALNSRAENLKFEYRIRDSSGDIQKQEAIIDILNLEDAILIETENLNPKSEQLKLIIKNTINNEFNNLKLISTSAFFDYEKTISLNAYERKELIIPINKDKTKTLNAGQYLVNNKIEINGKTTYKESLIKFLEQEDIETTETKEGLIIKRTEISKINLGNIEKTVTIKIKKSLISYLFTTTNIASTKTEFNGLSVIHTWEKEIIPNEELNVIVKTNWFFPLIILILIITAIYYAKKSVEMDLALKKHVSFVKTKGGQFALKVTLRVKSKKYLEKIRIIDKIPHLVKLYDKFGAIYPDNIDLKNRRIEWNIESLNESEERIFSYIIYSKIGVVGRFELPSARAIYEKEGKVKETTSNRSFFINEPRRV
ncbi:hypothetical protein HOD75_00360 [archaeon]|jgi:hypothetical protein|nr:hypothetical protein [archaeon]MBT4241328.1 hypothetical protein [archaeon]MBT4418149.1 hypothetical protein [archaeon]